MRIPNARTLLRPRITRAVFLRLPAIEVLGQFLIRAEVLLASLYLLG